MKKLLLLLVFVPFLLYSRPEKTIAYVEYPSYFRFENANDYGIPHEWDTMGIWVGEALAIHYNRGGEAMVDSMYPGDILSIVYTDGTMRKAELVERRWFLFDDTKAMFYPYHCSSCAPLRFHEITNEYFWGRYDLVISTCLGWSGITVYGFDFVR